MPICETLSSLIVETSRLLTLKRTDVVAAKNHRGNKLKFHKSIKSTYQCTLHTYINMYMYIDYHTIVRDVCMQKQNSDDVMYCSGERSSG